MRTDISPEVVYALSEGQVSLAWTPAEGIVCLSTAKRGNDNSPSQAALASTRFSIVKRSKGQSAVEKASYISRSVLVSEFDGQTYRPKYHEDLVHSEITLPTNAPKEYADRATLWNAIELSEKGQKSQLARMLKASLYNEWSYELAEEVVRDYVQRNFVNKGMCADWAIHDSENDKGQRNR